MAKKAASKKGDRTPDTPENGNRSHQCKAVHLKKGTDPINVRPYRYAFQQKEEMDKLVEKMLTSGVIRPSISLYSSSVLLVKKKDGS